MSVELSSLPRTIPVFPLSGALLLPGTNLPLNIFEPRYLDMVRDVLVSGGVIGVIQPADANCRDYEPALARTGCAGAIAAHQETSDGRILMTLMGVCRFTIEQELERTTAYRQVIADFGRFAWDLTPGGGGDGLRAELISRARRYFSTIGLDGEWDGIETIQWAMLVNSLAAICPFEPNEKQALLEADGIEARAQLLTAMFELAAGAASPDLRPPIH